MNPIDEKTRDSLNPFQANRLRVTFHYIDKVLADIESALHTTSSKAAFARYIDDISPAQRSAMEEYIVRLRANLVKILESQRIEREEPVIPVSRSVHVNLGVIDIAVEELKPKYMRGYGEVSERAAAELNGIVAELKELVQSFDRCLADAQESK